MTSSAVYQIQWGWLINLLNASLAFLIYGGWAAFVNSEYGLAVLIRSGLGQGVYAFFSTWMVTAVARKVLFHYGSNWRGFALSFLASFFIMLACPLTVHAILQTPEVIQAILPGLIWGSFYIAFVIKISSKSGTLAPADEH